MPANDTVSPDVSRAAVAPENLDLAAAVVDEYLLANGAWDRTQMITRIAQVMQVREIAVRRELAPKCLVCAGPCLPDDSFDTDECEREHYNRIANAAALDARTTAHMDARQMGEVA